ncbi:MAG: hypothetical protein AAFO85_15090 [Cyanobacteria bacterium J06598_4]
MLERKAELAIPQNLYALREKFSQLFPHGWDFIVKETAESTWKTIKKYKLTEQKCWYKYTDPEQIIGLRFGTETTHGLYDIDWGSIHDPREQEKSLSALKAELELYGIVSFVLLQSSDSGGLHLYFFLDRPVNTFRLACVMNKAAVEAKLKIERGQLETFPNTKRYNSLFNGHRLPLQQGSYLLDKDYTPYSSRLDHFLDATDWSAERNDTDLLESKLDEAYEWFKAQKNSSRVYSPTPEDKEFIEQVDYARREIKEGFLNKIRTVVEQGFTGEHETNELLLTIAKLGRILYGLSGQSYIDYIAETITSAPGYVKYCRHKHEIKRRCTEVARYGEQHWYPYRSSLPQNRSTYQKIKQSLTNQTNLNHERQHNARSRITTAVAIIAQQGQLPERVGECKLAIRNVTKELFGISVSDRTLNKPDNLPLWHPKHRQPENQPNNEPTIELETAEQHNPTPLPTTDNTTTNESNNPETRSPNSKTPPTKSASSIIQKKLQPEPPNNNQYKERATPLYVIRKNEPNPKPTKSIPSNNFEISCHTLPLMKGVLLDLFLRIWHSALLRAYSQNAIKQKHLVFVFSGYQGKPFSALAHIESDESITKSKSILPNSFVTIQTNLIHSSFLRDEPKQVLVYVRTLTYNDKDKSAMAVPIEFLSPCRYHNQILQIKNE